MRNFFSLLATAFLAGLTQPATLQAQAPDNYCGTHQTEADLQWLRAWQADPTRFAEFRRAEEDRILPVKVHIVGTDDGSGYYRLDQLMEAFCDVNEQYEATGFHFYIHGDINYINNSAYYAHDYFNGSNMMLENNIQQMINIYFVSDPSGACGYYTYGPDAIAIAKSCAADGNSTIAHEIGHYFSLPHTFYGWEFGTVTASAREKVARTNCNGAADGFCGTGPDYAPYRWNCPTTGPFTDPDGVEFVPDGTFYMSYSNDACTDKFSDDQQAAMHDYLNEEREDLLVRVAPDLYTHNPVEPIEPLNGTIGTAYNYTVLKWTKEANASGYQVSVGLNASLSAITYQAIVEDTFYILPELPTDRKHYWRVKPISKGNTCTPYTSTQEFTTGEIASGLIDFAAGTGALRAFPNPLSAGQALTVQFDSPSALDMTASLLSMDGRMLASRAINAASGENRVEWNLPELPEGLYLLELVPTNRIDNTQRFLHKVAITR